MTPSDDLSPPRRPIFFPVVIATVFLTIIGMTGGFVLGERHRNQVATPGETVTTPQAAQSSWPGERKPCPPEAIAFAAKEQLPTDLTQIFKVITVNGTTVWICEDGAGSLYYQSKTGGVSTPLVQGKNGLFLTDVVRDGDNEYEATATNGTRFIVNPRQLEVRFADDRAPEVKLVETVE